MQTPDDYSISMAYSYKNNEELSTYYNDSAKDYDDFVNSVGYVLPRLVAQRATRYLKQSDTVIDIGCGTGLLGIELNLLKDGILIHGVDISSEMIRHAYEKKKTDGTKQYEKLYHLGATEENGLPKNRYDLMVSSGTFTTGHLSGDGLFKMLNFMKSGSFAVFSVKSDHFDKSGFMSELTNMENKRLIQVLEISEVDSYENFNYSAMSKVISIKIN